MDVIVTIVILVMGYRLVRFMLGYRSPSPVTVAQKKADRFEIEKNIMMLEMLIDQREFEILSLDEKNADNRFDTEITKKLDERDIIANELRKEKSRLHEANKEVYREEMLQTF
jgi:hypothetical protein